jgi:glycosyltransferase involved in cell wall biosynthesis
MSDLPNDAVWMMPDEFDDAELIKALGVLWKDEQKRQALSKRAREVILTQHAPRTCADQYALAMEYYYEQAMYGCDGLVKAIAAIEGSPSSEFEWRVLAQKVAINHKPSCVNQLLLDISILVQCDAKSGIQRVVRSIISELLMNPPHGYRIEPIYAVPNQPGYRYAREFTFHFLGCTTQLLMDEPVEISNGDIFVGLDLAHSSVSQQASFYEHLKCVGGQVYFVIYDLLPIWIPNVFPENVPSLHTEWLKTVARSDGALCISRAVADEMMEWLGVFGSERFRPFKLGWFHLGADVVASVPTKGLPRNAEQGLQAFASRPTFLMVGTIEPRKGQAETLAAFEQLWDQGVDANLVLVGKQGWNMDLLVEKLRHHSESNKRLFWLEGISDEYLEKVYAASSCLIAASEGEGFGLPLIEAAQHKLPIIARDIPVFREVAGVHALYFSGLAPNALADCVRNWLELNNLGKASQSDTMPWLTWKQSTQNLLDVLLGGRWYQQWMPDGVYRYWGGDSRLGSQVGKSAGRDIVSTDQAGFLLFGPYIPLPAGQYQIVVHGALGKNGADGARMDVVIEKGANTLAKSVLKQADNGCLAMLPISLSTSCTDLEVRVWVEALSDVTISMLEIRPVQSSDAKSPVTPHKGRDLNNAANTQDAIK